MKTPTENVPQEVIQIRNKAKKEVENWYTAKRLEKLDNNAKDRIRKRTAEYLTSIEEVAWLLWQENWSTPTKQTSYFNAAVVQTVKRLQTEIRQQSNN